MNFFYHRGSKQGRGEKVPCTVPLEVVLKSDYEFESDKLIPISRERREEVL